ncbi:MAG: hypothetical protein LUC90_01460 [Lachnospiraceae bacterium]|nr:hypothetical protein [Lachnospiraceae bacterium]
MKSRSEKLNFIWKQNPALRVLLMIELAVIVFLLAQCFRSRCDYSFGPENFAVSGELVTEVVEEGELVGYRAQSDGEVSETQVLSVNDFTLYPGSYRVTVNYHSQVNYLEGSSIASGVSYFAITSESHDFDLTFNQFLLRDALESMDQTLQLSSMGRVDDFAISVTFCGCGEVTIYSVEIEEIVVYRYVRLLGALLLFAVFDLIVYLVFMDQKYAYKKELGLLTLICLAGVLPFIANYAYHGHDTTYHAQRILYLAEEISHGNYFPAIFSSALNDYGHAVPLFYCQFFLYLPAILFNCGCSLTFVYNLYMSLITVAACLIMYYCCLKIFRKSSTALLGAALYTLSAVRLTNLLTRAAFGEFTAQTWLPLVVLGFYQIYSAPKGEKITLKRYWPVVVGLSCIVVSHALTTLMSAIVICLFCVAAARKTLEPKRFLGLARAAVLTVLVSMAYLVPMVDFMGMDLLMNHRKDQIQNQGTWLLQVFNPIVNNYQELSKVDTPGSELSLSLGFPVVLGLVLFLVLLIRRSARKKEERESITFPAVCFAISLITAGLSTTYMFYDYMYDLPDSLYSLFAAYEFPWRWLNYASLFGVFCTTAVADRKEMEGVFGRVPVALVLVAVLTLNTGQIYSDHLRTSTLEQFDNNEYVNYEDQMGSEGEFLLYQSAVIGAGYYRDLLYDETLLLVENYEYGNHSRFLEVENLSDEEATVDVPMWNYDNYVACDTQTGQQIEITTGYNNRIELIIPAGYSGTIEISYQLPLAWKAAIWGSVLTDICVIGYAVLGGISRRKTHEKAIVRKEEYV